MIMSAARAVAQAHGYNGLSFRELAKEVGVKSASIHYYYPTKGDLGAALARRYSEDLKKLLNGYLTEFRDPVVCLRKYTDVFRRALENRNCMCLCGFMAAEYDDLPDAMKVEIKAFADLNVAWLALILSPLVPSAKAKVIGRRALAIYAAVGGAQLAARSRADIHVYDEIIGSYRTAGLIPDRRSPRAAGKSRGLLLA
jgi:TetR/AcrR family transcriptional regulator, transcriptional repressor for nem operon